MVIGANGEAFSMRQVLVLEQMLEEGKLREAEALYDSELIDAVSEARRTCTYVDRQHGMFIW